MRRGEQRPSAPVGAAALTRHEVRRLYPIGVVAARAGPSAAGHLIEGALALTPHGAVRRGPVRAQERGEVSSREAAAVLGSGAEVSAADTVPFVLWCAARWLDDFETAMWGTVSGLGDRDTTCAMVGGVVALATGTAPAELVAAREPLPTPFDGQFTVTRNPDRTA